MNKDALLRCIEQCASVDLAIDVYRETQEQSVSLGDQGESELFRVSQAGLNLTG